MASATRREDDGPDGVEFVREDDGTVTARDLETGFARGGETRAEALTQLAEVLTLEAGGGEPIADPDGFLQISKASASGLDPEGEADTQTCSVRSIYCPIVSLDT